MSERNLTGLAAFVIALVVGCLGTEFGYKYGWSVGRTDGRAEMKRWQDDYYAAHITVTPRSDCHLQSGELCVVLSVSDWQDLVRKSFRPIEVPPPPKPHKKPAVIPPNSYACYESQGDGNVLVRPCTDAERAEELRQMEGTAKLPIHTGPATSFDPVPDPAPVHIYCNNADWQVKLAPCEGGIYRFHHETGIIECELSETKP